MAKAKKAGATLNLQVSTLMSKRTKQGMVELVIGRETVQLELAKARQLLETLQAAIESATADTLVFAYLTESIGLGEREAAAGLVTFRQLRQELRDGG